MLSQLPANILAQVLVAWNWLVPGLFLAVLPSPTLSVGDVIMYLGHACTWLMLSRASINMQEWQTFLVARSLLKLRITLKYDIHRLTYPKGVVYTYSGTSSSQCVQSAHAYIHFAKSFCCMLMHVCIFIAIRPECVHLVYLTLDYSGLVTQIVNILCKGPQHWCIMIVMPIVNSISSHHYLL